MKLMFDKNELQTVQDSFCASNHVSVQLWTMEQEPCTKFSGDSQVYAVLQQVRQQITWEQCREEMENCLMEDMIEEKTGRDDLRYCLIPVRNESETIAFWEMIGFIEEKTTETDFWRAADLLVVLSKTYFSIKFQKECADWERRRTKQKMDEAQSEKREEQMLLRILERSVSRKPFLEILNQVTQEAGEFWNLSSVSVLQISADEKEVEQIGIWQKACVVQKEKTSRKTWKKEDLPFWTGRASVVSTGTVLPQKFSQFLQENGIRAFAALPICREEKAVMYLLFMEKTEDRTWKNEELCGFQKIREIIEQVLEKRIEKNSLTGSYQILEQVLANMQCGVYVTQPKEKQVMYANTMLKKLFGQNLNEMRIQILSIPSEHNKSEIYISETEQWLEVHQTKIDWIHGETCVLGTVYDITDKKNYQLLIEREANHDFLTGLYNRRRLEDDLKEAVLRVKEVELDGALLYLDLDDFKYINEGLGHQYGDVLIQSIAKKLRQIQGLSQNCYRVGGDEFMIIVTNSQYMDLNRILEEIRSIFSKPFLLKKTEYYCSMSMGIARFPRDGEEVSELIKKSDIALYEAKRKGKNRVEYYDDTVEASSIKRLDLEKNMRQAISENFDEFEVYYQPVVDAAKPDHPCEGAEALIRWNSPELGMISPVEFIPLAEYLGLIIPIGEYVLRQACARCRCWNEHGHPEYKVNVNLSIIQLLQNNIVETIKDALEKSQLNPENLILEVTEGLAVNDMVRMKHVLEDIRQLGVSVALDDFGTGYSSLNHVREMPIDVIKIDRCFITDIGRDEYAGVFVKIVRELAQTLGMRVCVEGVENDTQYHILQQIGVDLIQGYYFDKPMKAEDFEAKYL
ncbi:MAG: EAL domain-containing protein [Lachnospiraceae bacterium]